uniref:CG15717-PA n=1 Tax=Drosophila phaeopleura TaxID=195712 RepID=D1GZ21_9MUSC|nr:CG15717-PA [Drosophila phaeopleura]
MASNSNSQVQTPSLISSDMVNKLPGSQAQLSAQSKSNGIDAPQLMIVFDAGDLNSARQQLLPSLQDPFAAGAVATVLLQESIAEQFVGLVAQDLRPLSEAVAQNPSRVKSLAQINKLKLKVVKGEHLNPEESPLLVYDTVHSYLGGGGATGVITLHVFRTAKEAGELAKRDALPFGQVSIWNEKLACAYELVSRLSTDIFALNCFGPDLSPIREAFTANRNDVALEKNYHYESLVVGSKRRIIVFPVGTIFAN